MKKRKDGSGEKYHNPKNNRGSTLIVVIVGISFMTILSMIIVAVSAANLQMKYQEYTARRNFYTDETVLDDIYHGIGKEANEFLAVAYREVLARTSTDTTQESAEFQNQEAAFNAFSQRFVNRLIDRYGDNGIAVDPDLLQSYIAEPDPIGETTPLTPGIIVDSVGAVEIIDDAGTPITRAEINDITGPRIPYQFIIQDVRVVYREANAVGGETGYESTITTDIVIEVPFLNFFQDSSRILEYALVGNKGIYIYDGGNTGRSIIGNVYAGIGRTEDDGAFAMPLTQSEILTTFHGVGDMVSTEIGVYGGLNIANSDVLFSSNYLISKGDINMRGARIAFQSDLSAAGGQVWTESIRTVARENRRAEGPTYVGSEVSSRNTDFYVANDLELNEDNSSFVMSGGNYYGYNAGTYETWEQKGNLRNNYITFHHGENSAVIMNGRGTSVELQGEVIVNGVAYVDLAGRPVGNNYNSLRDGVIDEYATGDSLAFKTSQYIYLAPSDYLTVTNPINLTEWRNSHGGSDEGVRGDQVWQSTSANWFGEDTVGEGPFISSNPQVVHRDVIDRNSDEVFRYYFLNFVDERAASLYSELIMNIPGDADFIQLNSGNAAFQDLFALYRYQDYSRTQQNEMWRLREALTARLVEARMAITNGYSRIFTQGAFSTFDGTDLQSRASLLPDTDRLTLEYARRMETELHNRYVSLYRELDPQEGASLTDLTSYDRDDLQYQSLTDDLSPAGEFVDFAGLTAAALVGTEDTAHTYRDSGFESILSTGNVVLNQDFSGIIICNGNVTVNNGVDVRGLVIAGGKIFIRGDGFIESNRSIVQTILDEELRIESARPLDPDGSAPDAIRDYVITYLAGFEPTHSALDRTLRVSGSDYTQFMSYQQWRRG